jgi:hypothetical protein
MLIMLRGSASELGDLTLRIEGNIVGNGVGKVLATIGYLLDIISSFRGTLGRFSYVKI